MRALNWIIVPSLLGSISCSQMFQSHARVVKKQPSRGGIIAISMGMDGGQNARLEAQDMMSANCRGRYNVVEESEVVVGTREHSDTHYSKHYPSRSTSSTSSDLTEWRLTYECEVKTN